MTPKSAPAHDKQNRKSNPAGHEAQALFLVGVWWPGFE
jgi:hypothetical protein